MAIKHVRVRFLLIAAAFPAAAASCDVKITYPLPGTIVPPGDVVPVLGISREAGEESSCEQLCIQLDQGRPLCAAADDMASGTIFTGLSVGYHNLTISSGETGRGASSWFHVSPGVSAEEESLRYKAHLIHLETEGFASTVRLVPLTISRFDTDVGLGLLYMQRFGVGGFALVEPAESSQDDDIRGEAAATVLEKFMAQELVLQELRTMSGLYLNISGFAAGGDGLRSLQILTDVQTILFRDTDASQGLFAALGDALDRNPLFADAAHMRLNLAWALKMPQEFLEAAVQVASQSIEAGRSFVPAPSHLQPPRPISGVLLLTVASHSNLQLELLSRSASAVGMDLRIEGLGEPWRGFGDKIFRTRQALEGVDDSRIVLFLDAFDTLLLPSASMLIRRFLWLGADIIFGAELACTHDDGLRLLYPPHLAAAGAFLNSGTYAGRASDVRRMLDEVIEDLRRHHEAFGGDVLLAPDQRWLTRFFLRHATSGHVVLDAGRTLFLAMHAVPPSDVSLVVVPGNPPLLRYGPTDTTPLVLHGNGGGKRLFTALAADLLATGWPPLPSGAFSAAAAVLN